MVHNTLSLKHLPQSEACGYHVYSIRNCQPMFFSGGMLCSAMLALTLCDPSIQLQMGNQSALDLYVCSFPMVRTV